MATWDTTDTYFSGQGVVMLAERAVDGSPMGFVPVGNVSDLKLSIAVSTIEHKEAHTGQRSIDLRLTTETKGGISMTMENFDPASLARVTRGSSTLLTGTSVSDYSVVAYLGKIIALPHAKISAVTVSDGATPLVAGTDYWVNADAGSIKLNNTITGVADGDTLTVDYTYAAQAKVDALTEGASELYMRFEGLNTADGNNPVVVEVFKFLVDPLKELALIGDNVQSFVLEGSILADSTRATGSKYFNVIML